MVSYFWTQWFLHNWYFLSSNINFGKSIENVRNRWNLQVVDSAVKHANLVNLPNFVGSDIFSEKVVVVKMRERKALLNKPYPVGFVSKSSTVD